MNVFKDETVKENVSDKDLKKTLTSSYGKELANQVLALLSV